MNLASEVSFNKCRYALRSNCHANLPWSSLTSVASDTCLSSFILAEICRIQRFFDLPDCEMVDLESFTGVQGQWNIISTTLWSSG